MISRRDIARALFAAPLAAAQKGVGATGKWIDSKFAGVEIGAQSYSFRDMPLDACIKGYVDSGIGYAELWSEHLEPKDKAALKKWRTGAPQSFFADVRNKFDRAGVRLVAYNYSFREDFTDAEIDYGFKMTNWMGLDKITASSNVSTANRLDPYAQKYKTYVGFHNHANKIPNEFATPEDFEKALAGKSKYLCINLDIGHAVAAGWDPIAFLKSHHARIVTIHLKDRTPNAGATHNGQQGDDVVWGTGKTDIKGALLLLKNNRWPIPAMIEYEYPGKDTVTEMRRCVAYCRNVLV